jgi:hypothetical protein
MDKIKSKELNCTSRGNHLNKKEDRKQERKKQRIYKE